MIFYIQIFTELSFVVQLNYVYPFIVVSRQTSRAYIKEIVWHKALEK